MGSKNHPLQDHGIYHNLPTFDPSITNLHAIITGANGISGFHTMRALLESPHRWTKIYALSRKPPPKEMLALLTPDQRSRIHHVAVDFLSPPSEIAKALREANIQASHIFFYSYLQPKPDPSAPKSHTWSNASELVSVNKTLLENFLLALREVGMKPTRFLLQTGAKTYGVHIGRHRTPACESDPQPQHLEPNFYYPQEELLFEYVNSVPGCAWNVVSPAWIIGAVTTAQINGFQPWAVYAAVQGRKGEGVRFPSDWGVWQDERCHASARLTGYLSEWVVLEEKCADQRFNAQDTAPVSWDRFFGELGRWYGAKGVEGPSEAFEVMVAGKGGEDAPMGYGPPVEHRYSFKLVDWAKENENRAVWEEMMRESAGRLTFNPFDDPEENFQMGDAVLIPMATLNMNKARRMGWTGYVDTIESIFEMYRENARLGLLPEMVVDEPRPLI
ncbi:hypothetical protein M409DRAFT_66415 [Zasmidium cellare ATCC 36951]|uniref:PRISE-like Rossmann-fold domain-containing protein n=1 Tax=Zasmidium cellare ATCC 36951 TaxID=1080233 RepID=A0A6A6CN39_ZASCE|nr:uncharacterized protein M409DRAFT_66415 [Zasmidium cellare ATCC 36951]KAF2166866.1 hypothetical protein M409DRAFT_66415 [Zasmidium cellare ATCC 36951]